MEEAERNCSVETIRTSCSTVYLIRFICDEAFFFKTISYDIYIFYLNYYWQQREFLNSFQRVSCFKELFLNLFKQPYTERFNLHGNWGDRLLMRLFSVLRFWTISRHSWNNSSVTLKRLLFDRVIAHTRDTRDFLCSSWVSTTAVIGGESVFYLYCLFVAHSSL